MNIIWTMIGRFLEWAHRIQPAWLRGSDAEDDLKPHARISVQAAHTLLPMAAGTFGLAWAMLIVLMIKQAADGNAVRDSAGVQLDTVQDVLAILTGYGLSWVSWTANLMALIALVTGAAVESPRFYQAWRASR